MIYQFHHLSSCDSTNDIAIAMATEGKEEGLCVTADFQTAGRGRQGNHWVSNPGENLLMSLLVRPHVSANRASGLTLMTADVVQDLLKDFEISSEIKPPNDVLVNQKKIAGILTESQTQGERVEWCVIGIGLNINAPINHLPPQSTSLRELLGREVEIAKVKDQFLGHFTRRYSQYA